VTGHDVVVATACGCSRWPRIWATSAGPAGCWGVHRSTYYRLKEQVQGLEARNVRERRRRGMANQIGPHLEQWIVAVALARRAFGSGGSASSWPGEVGWLRISEHGVWRALVRLGLAAGPRQGRTSACFPGRALAS
jgi:hypothetical protein